MSAALTDVFGRIIAPDGTPLPGAVITFRPSPDRVTPADSDTLVPRSVQAQGGVDAAFAVQVLPGEYRVTVSHGRSVYPEFRAVVPDEGPAILSDIMDELAPPLPVLNEIRTLRGEAVLSSQSAAQAAADSEAYAAAAAVARDQVLSSSILFVQADDVSVRVAVGVEMIAEVNPGDPYPTVTLRIPS